MEQNREGESNDLSLPSVSEITPTLQQPKRLEGGSLPALRPLNNKYNRGKKKKRRRHKQSFAPRWPTHPLGELRVHHEVVYVFLGLG